MINLIREIFSDRRLMLDLSLKDMQRRFAGTYFGMVWVFLQPLLTIIIYWAVFQFGFRSGDVDDMPFVLWFISGIICWLFVSEAIMSASNSFLEYSYLIEKVKFNINILPMVKILSGFYIHLFFVAIVVVICAIFKVYPSLMFFQLIYYMFATIVNVFALTLLTSSIVVFFRDMNQIINIVLLFVMWGTPIAWNINIFTEDIQNILKLNPFYYLVEGYRDALLGRKWFWEEPWLGIYFWLVTFVMLFVGVKIYVRLKPHFADTV